VNVTTLAHREQAIVAKAWGSSTPYGIMLDRFDHWVGAGLTSLVGPTATYGWAHVALVQDGADNSRMLYVNGVPVAAGLAQAADGAGALWIGNAEGTDNFYAAFGTIDDVRLYDRALSHDYMAALANPHVNLAATASDDAWTVRLNTAGDQVEFLSDTSATPAMTRPIDTVGSITFTGGSGNDRLTADFSRGEVAPLYGFTFTGGGGADTLAFRGVSALDPFTVTAAGLRHTLGGASGIALGGADALEFSTGTFNVNVNLGGKQLSVRNGATTSFAASQDLASLIVDSATAVLTAGGAKVIDTSGLSIINGGSLDLSDNDLIWRNGSASALASQIANGALLTSWWNFGANGLGINPGFYFRQNLGDDAPFAGRSVADADMLVKYTYAGDVNLDGLVDAADYGIIDYYWQFPGTDGYWNGDFNYDGIIDAADYGYIDNSFQTQGAPL